MITDLRYRHASIGQKIFIICSIIVMSIYVVLIIYPIFNMFISSFKTTREILQHPFSMPSSYSFKNIRILWIDKHFGLYFANSFLITVVAMVFVLLFGSMASFGISRYTFKGNMLLYMIFLSGIMLPLKAAVIPLFMLIKKLNLVNNRLSCILIFTGMGLPSTVFILAGFMKSIPKELEYAGRIDGCSDVRIYWQIFMPLCASSIALVTIYNAVPIWNDFFFPLVFLQRDSIKTLPVGLSSFFGTNSTNWEMLFTGLSVAILPMIILYLFMSKYFIKGMTAGAVKS
ncbi:MAG: carbohydrate ABC transporter permease [Spirochaetia bacterium]|jgi:raffinose/stachyose/melibiose transport system permease protein|nr:carbohydrate ABC transporter permease [Spirochaetia bacterium]